MGLVCHLEGKFLEHRQCSNSDYCLATFAFPEEVYGKVFSVEDMPRPKKTTILFNTQEQAHLFELKPNQKYKLQVSLTINPPNSKDGKEYPAQLNINIIKFQPC